MPIGYSAGALAYEIYGTATPTAAQLSAVRRALRGGSPPAGVAHESEREYYTGVGTHTRSNGWRTWTADNPAPVQYTREMTGDERAVREKFAAEGRAMLQALGRL